MFNESTKAEGQTRFLEIPGQLIEETEGNEGILGLEEKVQNLESHIEGIATRLDELQDHIAAAHERHEQIFNLQVMQLEGLTTIMQVLNRTFT